MARFEIDADIRRARSLPSELYFEPAWFARQREAVFDRGWHAFPHDVPREPGAVHPWSLGGVLVVLARDGGAVRCLSNVCTHRGNLLVDAPCVAPTIRCRYHGRRFGLDGSFHSMPEFEGAESFPSASDDLPSVPTARLGPMVFASLSPAVAFDELIAPVRERIDYLPIAELAFDGAVEYAFDANWALYCDNYLEGFHIPFVHPALSRALDFSRYRTELMPYAVLQLGVAADGELAFEPPPGHPDAGERVAGYYFWLWPATMLNVYPWGISLNAVIPESPTRTRVRFVSWVWRPELREQGAGVGLHQVELEDEQVVLACQRGVQSPLYERGRYSPKRERGVHHFHRLLARSLA